MYHTNNILISGASTGIGRELALKYAKANTRLILFARSVDKLKTLARECEKAGADVVLKGLDVTDREALTHFIHDIDKEYPIRLAIANAGVMNATADAQSLEIPEHYLPMADTNFTACIHFVSLVAEGMSQRQSGQIAIIASLSAVQPITRAPTYSATKAGVSAYGEAMRTKLYPLGVKVNVILPGFIATNMTEKFRSFQPFKMTAARAADRIVKAIDRDKAYYVFPKRLYWMSILGRLLPWSLRRHVLKGFG